MLRRSETCMLTAHKAAVTLSTALAGGRWQVASAVLHAVQLLGVRVLHNLTGIRHSCLLKPHLCTRLQAGLLWSRAFSNTRSNSRAPSLLSRCCLLLSRLPPVWPWPLPVCSAASLKNLMACSVHLASCCRDTHMYRQGVQHGGL